MSQKLENPPPTGASPLAPAALPQLKPQFAAAALTLNQYGICKELRIDGHKLLQYIANVARSDGVHMLRSLFKRWNIPIEDVPAHEKQ